MGFKLMVCSSYFSRYGRLTSDYFYSWMIMRQGI